MTQQSCQRTQKRNIYHDHNVRSVATTMITQTSLSLTVTHPSVPRPGRVSQHCCCCAEGRDTGGRTPTGTSPRVWGWRGRCGPDCPLHSLHSAADYKQTPSLSSGATDHQVVGLLVVDYCVLILLLVHFFSTFTCVFQCLVFDQLYLT